MPTGTLTPDEPLPPAPEKRKFGAPLDEFSDVEQLQAMCDKLWSILDDLDTLGDMLKPAEEAGYRQYYELTCRRVEQRHEVLESDGYKLFLPQPKETP